MKTYRFSNKSERQRLNYSAIFVAVFAAISIFDIGLAGFDSSWFFMFSSIVFFILTMIVVRRAYKGIEVISFEKDAVSLMYFNRNKEIKNVLKKEIQVIIKDSEHMIVFKDKNNHMLGIAKKSQLKKEHDWEEFLFLSRAI